MKHFTQTALSSIDSYKLGHADQFPEGTTKVYSNFTPRSLAHLHVPYEYGTTQVVWFGLQVFLNDLQSVWQETFFDRPKAEVVAEFVELVGPFCGPRGFNQSRIEWLHDLGYLPIEIKSLPEGTLVPAGVPVRFRCHEEHRQFPAGSRREHGLQGHQAFSDRDRAAVHAHHPGRHAAGVHARLCRLRHPAADRSGLPHLPGGDLQPVSGRERHQLQLRLSYQRDRHHCNSRDLLPAKVGDPALQLPHQRDAPGHQEKSHWRQGLFDASLLLPADRGRLPASDVYRLPVLAQYGRSRHQGRLFAWKL